MEENGARVTDVGEDILMFNWSDVLVENSTMFAFRSGAKCDV